MRGKRLVRNLSMAVFLLNVAVVVRQWFAPIPSMWNLWLMLLVVPFFVGMLIHFNDPQNTRKELLRGCPGWLIAVMVLCWGYSFVYFFLTIAWQGRGAPSLFTNNMLAFTSLCAAHWTAWARRG